MALTEDDYEIRKQMLDNQLDAMRLVHSLAESQTRIWEQISAMLTDMGMLTLDIQQLRKEASNE